MLLLDVRVEQIVYFGMIVDLFRSLAALEAEIVVLRQQLIVAVGSSAVGQVLQATRTVPIVFVFAPDPVGSGFVNSLSRPGGNATGFMAFEYSLRGRS
jgi:putative tryptophan/tyrosine transport system substrate-binding protein